MKKKLFSFLFMFSFLFVLLGFFGIKGNASSNILAKLEQQENSSSGNETKIRYIATIENVYDLNDIKKITFNFYMYKYDASGSYSKSVSYDTTKVYDKVLGTNGKDMKDNTYYAVFTVTDLNLYIGYTLSTYVTLDLGGETIETNLVSHTIQDEMDSFFKGMDTSAVPSLEAAGVVYRNDNGEEEDVFRVLADHGVNFIRVRIWNDPYYEVGDTKYGYGGGNCDLDNAILIGKRANKYGMKLLLDFHYSDFWADPAKQKLPKAWEGLTAGGEYNTEGSISKAIYDFTYESLQKIKAAGIDVGMVQVGNETNDALCGSIGESSMETVCKYFTAGAKAVREIYSSAYVAVHFANPSNYNDYIWYASELNTYNVDFDVFGTSYYPYWHGSLSNLSKLLSTIATTYNKKVCVLETAYANTEEYMDERSDGYSNTVYTRSQELEDDTNASLPYEFSIEGQKSAILGLMDTIKNHTTNGLGIFYWEGTWIKTPSSSASVASSYATDSETYGTGWGSKYAYYYDSDNYLYENGGCAIENEAFFDQDGNPFESLDVFMTDTSSDIERSINGYAAANLCNPSFEDVSLDGWNVIAPSNTWPNTSNKTNGSYGLSFGSSDSFTLDISQDISYITYGTYKLSFDIMGNDCSNTLYLYVKVNDVLQKQNVTLSGWGNWNTYSLTFDAELTDKVEVGFYMEAENIWGYIDNFELERKDNSNSQIIYTNTLENPEFNSLDGWTLVENLSLDTKEIKADSYATNNQTNAFNFYSANANSIDFTLSQDISGNEGCASLSFSVSGGSYTDIEIYAYISVNGVIHKGTTLQSLNGWDNWISVSVNNVSINEDDTVIAGIYVLVPDAGGWGYIDNANLTIN